MTKTFATEQEAFWAGEFDDAYCERNADRALVAPNIALFSQTLRRTSGVRSAIEFGANVGLNLVALRALLPSIELAAVEINPKAVEKLASIPELEVHAASILEFEAGHTYDLALIKGVLIHIDPASLGQVYDRLYRASSRYICVAEYYNPAPVEVTYRGHSQRLFKRDFAGEMLDRFPDLSLVDYGFAYHRDANFPQDDTTWFLLEKRYTDGKR